MKTISKALTKGTIGAVAAGAMAMTSATPAMARDRDGGIDAGDVIAGAVILGGIAAVAAAVSSNDRDRRYRGNYRYNNRYARYGGSPSQAVEQCVRAVERNAQRAGYRFADVTQIRDVDDRRNGWRVKGRLVVEGNRYRGGYNRYNSRYDRYDRRDRRGYRNRDRDTGNFTCYIDRGRVYDINYGGIRGL